MVFEIRNKVALITGGASGIGLEYAKELLRNEAKGVVLADLNPEYGTKAVAEIANEFGHDKAIFITTDVTSFQQFEEAFLKTIDHFKNVDILINNAGILNDAVWEKEITININGTVHGMLLAMDKYLPKYKQFEEALIVNISSVAGIQGFGFMPVYCGTKSAILAMVKSWGIPEFYAETKVRVIGICPGPTVTPLLTEILPRNLGARYQKVLPNDPTQEPNFVAKEVMKAVKYGGNGTIWVIESGLPAFEYVVPPRNTMENNTLPC